MYSLKNIGLLLVIVSLTLINCEGRKTPEQSLKESVEAFKAKTTIEDINYTPERYSEVKIDSTLTNGFSINVKHYTDMKHAFVLTKSKDNRIEKINFRHWISDLKISFNNNIVVNTKVNNSFIKQLSTTQNDFNYSHLEILQEKSTKDSITINLYALKPKSKDYLIYELKVYNDGTIDLENIIHV